jgi:hypothetical protein
MNDAKKLLALNEEENTDATLSELATTLINQEAQYEAARVIKKPRHKPKLAMLWTRRQYRPLSHCECLEACPFLSSYPELFGAPFRHRARHQEESR